MGVRIKRRDNVVEGSVISGIELDLIIQMFMYRIAI
jgi:hypothetical protein